MNQPVSIPDLAPVGGSADAPRDRQVGGDHYRSKPIQPWDAMAVWMSPEQFEGFLRGNAIKYLARYPEKGDIEDLKKAAHYLDRLIQLKEGQR